MLSSGEEVSLWSGEEKDPSRIGKDPGVLDQNNNDGFTRSLFPVERLNMTTSTQNGQQMIASAPDETPTGFLMSSSLETANNLHNPSLVLRPENFEKDEHHTLPSEDLPSSFAIDTTVPEQMNVNAGFSSAIDHNPWYQAPGTNAMPYTHAPSHQSWSGMSTCPQGAFYAEAITLQSNLQCDATWPVPPQHCNLSDFCVPKLSSEAMTAASPETPVSTEGAIEEGFFENSYFGLDDTDAEAQKSESSGQTMSSNGHLELGKTLYSSSQTCAGGQKVNSYSGMDTQCPELPLGYENRLGGHPNPCEVSSYHHLDANDNLNQKETEFLCPPQYSTVGFEAPLETDCKLMPNNSPESGSWARASLNFLNDTDRVSVAISRTKLKYGSREQAKQAIDNTNGEEYVSPQDSTRPIDEEEEAICAVMLLDAALEMEEAEDSTNTAEGWKKIMQTRRSEVELAVWTVLDKMIDYHNRKGFLGKHQFSSKATAKYGTFAEHMKAISGIFRRSKTVCRHLLQEPYIISLVDDPEALAKRVRGNRNVNDSKKNVNKTNAALADAILAAQKQGNGLTKEQLADLTSKSNTSPYLSKKHAATVDVGQDLEGGRGNGPQKKRKTSTAAEAETIPRRTRGLVSSNGGSDRQVAKRQSLRKGRPRGSKTATLHTGACR